MVTFKRENGLCPYYISNGIKYYIMDRHIGGNDYEYRLESRPAKTEYMKINTLKDAVKYLNAKPWEYHKEYSIIYEIRKGEKLYIYNADKKTLRELKEPDVLTGWHDSYEECLKVAKQIIESEIGEQISIAL